jgi:hypothetical protein
MFPHLRRHQVLDLRHQGPHTMPEHPLQRIDRDPGRQIQQTERFPGRGRQSRKQIHRGTLPNQKITHQEVLSR